MLPFSVILTMAAMSIVIMPLVVVVYTAYFCSNGFNNGNAFAYNAYFNISVPISVFLTLMAMPILILPLVVLVCQFLLF